MTLASEDEEVVECKSWVVKLYRQRAKKTIETTKHYLTIFVTYIIKSRFVMRRLDSPLLNTRCIGLLYEFDEGGISDFNRIN